MEPTELYLPEKPGAKAQAHGWLYRTFITEKLCNPFGVALLLLAGIVVAFGVGKFGILFAAGVLGISFGIPFLVAFVRYPIFAIVVTTSLSYFLFGIGRLGVDFPLGTVMDVFELLMVLGFYIKIRPLKNWSVLNGSVGFIFIAWILYNVLEVLNPVAESQLAWLYTIRSVAIIVLTYFVFVYQVNSTRMVRVIIKTWIALSFLAALYGFKQEFFGFTQGELNWLQEPGVGDLLLIDGHWRKFSFFSDPVAFSYNMAISAVLCIVLMTGPIKAWKKWILFIMMIVMLIAMLFSGTRGAFVLVPVALAFLAVLKFNLRIMIVTLISGAFLAGLIFVPTSNPAIYRFQSAFKPNDDPSFLVRKATQKKIQPYIRSHPFGGGLGATGGWGQRFAPDSYLASIPPDSGYVRVAVELGWVGLLLLCTLIFTILYTGIRNYYRIRDPELKTYALAMVLIIFALNIGNYPQEALVQYPNNLYFYMTAALIAVLDRLDKQKTKGLAI